MSELKVSGEFVAGEALRPCSPAARPGQFSRQSQGAAVGLFDLNDAQASRIPPEEAQTYDKCINTIIGRDAAAVRRPQM